MKWIMLGLMVSLVLVFFAFYLIIRKSVLVFRQGLSENQRRK
jgi:hypothetical protein